MAVNDAAHSAITKVTGAKAKRYTVRTLAALTIALCFLAFYSAHASDGFTAETVRMIIPSDPGGSTDGMARITGRFMSQHLPGRPNFIYLNDPGASGVKALNTFARRTKPDGLTVFAGSASNLDPTTLRNPAVLYTAKELRMFGGLPATSGVLLLRKDAVAKFNDKSLPLATMGDVTGVRTSGQMGVWGPTYLGWNLRWVIGYKGSAAVMKAALQGEVDMHATFERNIITQLMDTGDFVMPVQTGVYGSAAGKLVPGKFYMDVPVFSDLIKPHLKSEREISAFEAWETLVQGGKWFALPPETPAEIVTIYRRAFDEAVKGSEFAGLTAKVLGEDFTVATGEDMEKIADKTDLISDSDVAYFDELREKVGLRMQAATK